MSRQRSVVPGPPASSRSAWTCSRTSPGQTLETLGLDPGPALALEPDHLSIYLLTLEDPDADGLTTADGDHLPVRAGRASLAGRGRVGAGRGSGGGHGRAHRPAADAGRAGPLRAVQSRAAGSRESPQPGVLAASAGGGGRSGCARLRRRPDPPLERGPPGPLPGGLAARRRRHAATATRAAPRSIDARTARAESAILALRLARGVDASTLADPECRTRAWPGRSTAGLVRADGDRLVLTPRGRMLSNEVFARLLPDTPTRSPIGRTVPA